MRALYFALVFSLAIGCFFPQSAMADNWRGNRNDNPNGDWIYFRNDNNNRRHHDNDRNHQDYIHVDGHYGYWSRSSHSNRFGWWFVSGNRWYPYEEPRSNNTIIIMRESPMGVYQSSQAQLVPSAPLSGPNNEYCREFQSSIIVGTTHQPAYGIACQQPDNSWKIVR